MYSNGKSIFLESSSTDLHFSTVSENYQLYEKHKFAEPRYFGISLSDKILNDLVQEFHARRRQLNLQEFLSLFPDYKEFVEEMTLGKLHFLLP
jgi:hypothetical protein